MEMLESLLDLTSQHLLHLQHSLPLKPGSHLPGLLKLHPLGWTSSISLQTTPAKTKDPVLCGVKRKRGGIATYKTEKVLRGEEEGLGEESEEGIFLYLQNKNRTNQLTQNMLHYGETPHRVLYQLY